MSRLTLSGLSWQRLLKSATWLTLLALLTLTLLRLALLRLALLRLALALLTLLAFLVLLAFLLAFWVGIVRVDALCDHKRAVPHCFLGARV